jgi:predicted ABC-type ATPase
VGNHNQQEKAQELQLERELERELELELKRELSLVLDNIRDVASSFRSDPGQISLFMDQLQSEGQLTPLVRQQLGVEFTSMMGQTWADKATGVTPQGKSTHALGAAIMADAQTSLARMHAPRPSDAITVRPGGLGLESLGNQAGLKPNAPSMPASFTPSYGAQSLQMKGVGDEERDTDAIHEEAAKGVDGSGSSLPHAERIQEAFGDHDIGSIEAHVGGQAADASEAIGARAYARGNKIAFKDTPDLHTAAHEAAHIIQQRAGVSLEGGVGKTGDAYEQHADAVADAVVAGRDASGLLDQYADSARSSEGGIQRKEDAVQMEVGLTGGSYARVNLQVDLPIPQVPGLKFKGSLTGTYSVAEETNTASVEVVINLGLEYNVLFLTIGAKLEGSLKLSLRRSGSDAAGPLDVVKAGLSELGRWYASDELSTLQQRRDTVLGHYIAFEGELNSLFAEAEDWSQGRRNDELSRNENGYTDWGDTLTRDIMEARGTLIGSVQETFSDLNGHINPNEIFPGASFIFRSHAQRDGGNYTTLAELHAVRNDILGESEAKQRSVQTHLGALNPNDSNIGFEANVGVSAYAGAEISPNLGGTVEAGLRAQWSDSVGATEFDTSATNVFTSSISISGRVGTWALSGKVGYEGKGPTTDPTEYKISGEIFREVPQTPSDPALFSDTLGDVRDHVRAAVQGTSGMASWMSAASRSLKDQVKTQRFVESFDLPSGSGGVTPSGKVGFQVEFEWKKEGGEYVFQKGSVKFASIVGASSPLRGPISGGVESGASIGIQFDADRTPDAAAVQQHAERGVSGGGGRLPYQDQIQASFGGHDVSGIESYTGGSAADASKAMGARAYATGNKVAFGQNPNLHTAAHEAAHVVQQRGGVSLKGGVGQVGDTYEQHADAVADKVVAGESAQGLLDQMAGSSGSEQAVQGKSPAATAPVQNKPVQFAKFSDEAKKMGAKETVDMTEHFSDPPKKEGDDLDGVITPTRDALHNQILKKYKLDTATEEDKQDGVAIVAMGGSGAGKSTLLKQLKAENAAVEGYTTIDPDALKDDLPEYKDAARILDGQKTSGGTEDGSIESLRTTAAFELRLRDEKAEIVHDESSVLSKKMKRLAIKNGDSVILDGTGSNLEKYKADIANLQSRGYTVHLIMPFLNVDKGLARVAARKAKDGRGVAEEKVREIYDAVNANFAELKGLLNVDEPGKDTWTLYDSDVDKEGDVFPVIAQSGVDLKGEKWAEFCAAAGYLEDDKTQTGDDGV